jgi:hypothetical protein
VALINTIYGVCHESELVKLEGAFEDEREKTTWVEYRLPGKDEIVHRSAHVHLKEPIATTVDAAALG